MADYNGNVYTDPVMTQYTNLDWQSGPYTVQNLIIPAVWYLVGGWQAGVWATPQRVPNPSISAWPGGGGPVPNPFVIFGEVP